MTAFLIDEMFSMATAELLRTTYGHYAVHVAEDGLPGGRRRASGGRLERPEGRAVVTENVADFAAERDVVLVFVLKKNLPAGGGKLPPGKNPRPLGAGLPGPLPRSPLAMSGHAAGEGAGNQLRRRVEIRAEIDQAQTWAARQVTVDGARCRTLPTNGKMNSAR